MWSDCETNRDYLNFRIVADTAAEMIHQSAGRPLSLGISGSWGVGKSSMIQLVQESLKARGSEKFLFVDFNAWLYQGYDDARAALIDVIARQLVTRAEKDKKGLEKAKDLLKRVDWFRVAKYTTSGIAMAYGIPPIGLAGEVLSFANKLKSDADKSKAVGDAFDIGEKILEAGKGLIKEKQVDSPPKEIQDLRDHFAATLKEMDVTLVVFVDDLDRCLPATAISTLEAIRLFLFLDNTAFVIAADDKMIRQSVSMHFGDLKIDEEHVTNYFDKLIQVPIRVPPLSTQDVRAYMMLLYVENSSLDSSQKDKLRDSVCKQLSETWQGKRVDLAFVKELIPGCPTDLLARLETADSLAPFMAAAPINGNPRLIKRFLNTLSTRLSIAKIQGVKVDEAVLAKMLLFERCGGEKAYSELITAINEDHEGKPNYLKNYEELAVAGKSLKPLPNGWNEDFMSKWLAIPPMLSNRDMRPVAHVSREHLPTVTTADQLSSEGANLLSGLLAMTRRTPSIQTELAKLGSREIDLMIKRLLKEANTVLAWGTPPILYALIEVIGAHPGQSEQIVKFFADIPKARLSAAIIPILKSEAWAAAVIKEWGEAAETPDDVKRAILGRPKKEQK